VLAPGGQEVLTAGAQSFMQLKWFLSMQLIVIGLLMLGVVGLVLFTAGGFGRRSWLMKSSVWRSSTTARAIRAWPIFLKTLASS